jgi:hypothetical protein
MPDGSVRAHIKHVDRQRAFTILPHIDVSSPIGMPPPAVIPGIQRPCVGHRIGLNIRSVVRPDRKVDDEIRLGGILDIAKALACKAALDRIPSSLNHERIFCTVVFARQPGERVVAGDVMVWSKSLPVRSDVQAASVKPKLITISERPTKPTFPELMLVSPYQDIP